MDRNPALREKIFIGVRYGLIYTLLGNLAAAFFISYLNLKIPSLTWPKEISLILFLDTVIVAPLLEELLFRFLPIKIVQRITSNTKIIWLVIILSSIGFGYIHGSWHHIFIQGIAGILYSKAFLKGGLVSSFTAHAVTNSFALIAMYIR